MYARAFTSVRMRAYVNACINTVSDEQKTNIMFMTRPASPSLIRATITTLTNVNKLYLQEPLVGFNAIETHAN